MLPELRKEYGVNLSDTINGRGESPALILIYVRALPEQGPTKALMAGRPELTGWTYERHLLAGIFDVIRENTMILSAPNYKQPISLDPWPRPGNNEEESDAEPEATGASIEDLWQRLSSN